MSPIRTNTVLLGLALAATAALLPALAARADPIVTGSGARGLTVPFRVLGNHAYVEVRVGESRPLHFIVESGASVTCVDSATAGELGLQVTGEARVAGGGPNLASVKLGELRGLKLGDSEAPAMRVVLQNMSNMSAKAGVHIDGLLGVDFLSRYVVELDYAASRLVLHDPAGFKYAGPGVTLPFRQEHTLIHFPAGVKNQGGELIQGEFVLDTGAGGDVGVYLSAPFAREHGIPSKEQRVMHAPHSGEAVGGAASGDVCRLAELHLGSITVLRPTAFVSTDEAGFLGQPGRAGLVGTLVLKQFRVFIDYPGKRVTFEKNGTFGTPFDGHMDGLDLSAEGPDLGVFRVHAVFPGSEAAAAGFRSGDLLESIGGQSLKGARMEDVRTWLRQESGGTIEVRILRGAESLKLSLPAAETL